jgi:hypothetical protein
LLELDQGFGVVGVKTSIDVAFELGPITPSFFGGFGPRLLDAGLDGWIVSAVRVDTVPRVLKITSLRDMGSVFHRSFSL